MNKRKKDDRWRRDFDELFGSEDMDDIFEAMREQMNRMMESMMSGDTDMSQLRPYVSGFSMRVGPDGQPHFERFGDRSFAPSGPTAKPDTDENGLSRSREPLTDIIDGEETLAITVEVPGVKKEDISLEVVEHTLVIGVNTEDRRYFKEVGLPCPVDEESAKATYNNGVLDIMLKKTKREKKSRKITVE